MRDTDLWSRELGVWEEGASAEVQPFGSGRQEKVNAGSFFLFFVFFNILIKQQQHTNKQTKKTFVGLI